MKAIEKRLQELEAERARGATPPMHIVQYVIAYGDDRKAKRAEAEAEFNRRNPYWASRPERDEEIRLIEIRVVEAVEGKPKHPQWLAYLDALKHPDRPESAQAIVAYESIIGTYVVSASGAVI